MKKLALDLTLPGFGQNGNITITDPYTPYSNLGQVASAALDMMLYIGAFLFFIWSLWGVFRYLTAEGEKEQLKKSRDQIRWALVGFLVVVAAIMVSRFVQGIILPNPIQLTPLTQNFFVREVFAQEECTCPSDYDKRAQKDTFVCINKTTGTEIPPTCGEGLRFNPVTGETTTKNPTVSLSSIYAFGDLQSLGALFSRLTPVVVAIFATMVVFYIVIGALKFIVSEGDKASVTEAKKTITHTFLAVIFFILLFLVVRFILPFFGIGISIF